MAEDALRAVLALLLLAPVLGDLSAHGGNTNKYTKAQGLGMLKDDRLVQDKEHIKKDLKGTLSQEHINAMSPKELEFQYFKAHDFDKNFQLDGLELMSALSHVFQDGGESEGLEPLSRVIEMIDEVLHDGDVNKDGFLNYREYRMGREKAANPNN